MLCTNVPQSKFIGKLYLVILRSTAEHCTFQPFQAILWAALMCCWCQMVTLKVGRKSSLNFRCCICLKAMLCYVNTQITENCGVVFTVELVTPFSYYFWKLWLPLCCTCQPLHTLMHLRLPAVTCSWKRITDKKKSRKACLALLKHQDSDPWKGKFSCVCISSWCLWRTRYLQVLQELWLLIVLILSWH